MVKKIAIVLSMIMMVSVANCSEVETAMLNNVTVVGSSSIITSNYTGKGRTSANSTSSLREVTSRFYCLDPETTYQYMTDVHCSIPVGAPASIAAEVSHRSSSNSNYHVYKVRSEHKVVIGNQTWTATTSKNIFD